MIEFIQELQRNTKKQIFIITHKQEIVDSVTNPIIIKKNNISEKKETIKSKKQRGRPKKK